MKKQGSIVQVGRILFEMEIPSNIISLLRPVYGKQCCRQRVWKPKSLFFGFGEKIYHQNAKLIDAYYGEWELGTYYGSWRILKDGKITCASNDLAEVEELQDSINQISFGCISSLKQLTDLDVRINFDSGIIVDFLSTISDDDQVISIINSSRNIAIGFSIPEGWTIEASTK